ncbi:MAG TPA: trypsin-like peptidase domain-containing protein [Candidatus Omnitrophota bacterium]|nr:trypsin-like peptidase domain-containing protein [Candidatus Omnitrophota bacterium]HPD84924.1 trypsin-like peptidase domain-containing protein [Candidatus Omnitrophota bacterium]HRZ03782.1 trypsin-like peptidase domain-containing protein [Candidatus Omnitrophota bacterium]
MDRLIKVFILMSFGAALLGSAAPGLAQTDDRAISNLFSQNADAVVLIGAADRSGKNSRAGTGFVITPDGFIVTNYHLLDKAKRIVIKLKNNTGYLKVKIVAIDTINDIALIKISGKNLSTVKLGDSDSVKVGQRVVTIGNPLGLAETVSDGLISSLRNTSKGVGLLQISVPLSPGSSGGPLFNLAGEVVGVTVASHPKGQNLNFAVPINAVKPLLRKTSYARYLKKSLGAKLIRNVPPPGLKQSDDSLKENNSAKVYIVQSGDTLFGIAKRSRTLVAELMRLNGLSDSKIYTGQKIRLPVVSSSDKMLAPSPTP